MRTGYIKSLAANWVGYAANIAVAFFLSPFIVSHLGEAGYGVWSLLMAVTGYLGLVDLGVRVTTGRYLNYYLGRNEHAQATETVNASLTLYSALGLIMLAAATVTGLYFPFLFPRLPGELAQQARLVLPILGLNMWFGLYAATFSQLLLANNRFDLKNASALSILAIRTAATVWVGMSLSLLKFSGGSVDDDYAICRSS